MFYKKEHCWTFALPWPDVFEIVGKPRMFLEECCYPQTIFMRLVLSYCLYFKCCYTVLYTLFLTPSSLNLIGFRLLLPSLST